METLKVTDQNTFCFKDDYDYLFFTLMSMQYKMFKYKKTLYYKHQIWTDDKGWWLTFQAYDLKTDKPIGDYDTKD